jgi:hypothetical protein
MRFFQVSSCASLADFARCRNAAQYRPALRDAVRPALPRCKQKTT